jgi:AcrR family transcriptional regulator
VAETIEWTPKARAVLEAASALFYERGIHAVGVDAIAASAGVTKKTLYDRFGSKDRLVAEYLAERDRRWRAHLDERLAGAGPEPVARLLAVFDAAESWAAEHGSKGCAMVNAHAEISDPAHPAFAVLTGQKAWMLELFVRLATEAGAPGPAAIGEQVMLLHEGATVLAGMGAGTAPFRNAADVAARLVG